MFQAKKMNKQRFSHNFVLHPGGWPPDFEAGLDGRSFDCEFSGA
jgi:hypothetical protein